MQTCRAEYSVEGRTVNIVSYLVRVDTTIIGDGLYNGRKKGMWFRSSLRHCGWAHTEVGRRQAEPGVQTWTATATPCPLPTISLHHTLHDNSLVKGHRPSTHRIDRIISCCYAVTLCDCVLRRNNAVPKRVADVLLQWADLSLFKLRLFLSFAHRLKCKS
jgi:hypothetical protein